MSKLKGPEAHPRFASSDRAVENEPRPAVDADGIPEHAHQLAMDRAFDKPEALATPPCACGCGKPTVYARKGGIPKLNLYASRKCRERAADHARTVRESNGSTLIRFAVHLAVVYQVVGDLVIASLEEAPEAVHGTGQTRGIAFQALRRNLVAELLATSVQP